MGLQRDRCHHTRNGLSVLPVGRSIKNYTWSTFTLEESASADLSSRTARFTIMPKRSFDVCLVILLLDDLVDGCLDLIEVLCILISERLILNEVSIQRQRRSLISMWRQEDRG